MSRENRQVGYVLVPCEPMPEMIGAWYRVKNGFHFHDEPAPADTSDYAAYRAMIAAAPASDLEQVSRERDEAVRLLRGFIRDDADAQRNPMGGLTLGGLMDCRDNNGCVYQSHSLDQVLTDTRAFLNNLDNRNE